MADDDKKKVKGIDKARKSTSIHQVESVDEVQQVKKTERVGKVGKSGAAGDASTAGRQMTYAEREELLSMVDEEAAKIFGNSKIPKDQKAVIQKAVKMAIDAAIVPEDGEDEAS